MAKPMTLREAVLISGLILSLAQPTAGAWAFTPEPVPAPSASKPSPDSKTPVAPGQTPAELADPYAAGKPKGTELSIPGIGSIGVLPKLDFGLELLYGPPNSNEGLALDQRTPEADVQIKGTFKHKF